MTKQHVEAGATYGRFSRSQPLLLVVSVVGVALEGVDVQVLVVVLCFLRFRFRRSGAAEQLESLKRNHAEQSDDDGDKDNLCRMRKLRKARRFFFGVKKDQSIKNLMMRSDLNDTFIR